MKKHHATHTLTDGLSYELEQWADDADTRARAARTQAWDFFVVDGAHGPGQLNFNLHDLGCDVYAASLHKWFFGPRGTGCLFLRRDRIKDVAPLFPPASHFDDNDTTKFEAFGTVQLAVPAVLPVILRFTRKMGAANKEVRLRYLRDHWAKRLAKHERVRFWTDLQPEWSCAITSFEIKGMDPVTVKTSSGTV